MSNIVNKFKLQGKDIKEAIVKAREDERTIVEGEWREKLENKEMFIRQEFFLELQEKDAKIEALERELVRCKESDRKKQDLYEDMIARVRTHKEGSAEIRDEFHRLKDTFAGAFQVFARISDKAEYECRRVTDNSVKEKIILGLEEDK